MKRRRLTDLEWLHLIDLYPDHPTKDIAEFLGRSLSTTYQNARLLGMKKSQTYLNSPASGRTQLGSQLGAAGRYPKGHRPWNTGLKGAATGGYATQFKKGQMPHNHVAIGTVVAATEGYFKIKVAEPNKWEWLHRKLWQEAHGPIAKGMALIFKDRNWRNCVLDNLELITRQQLLARNGRERYGKELLRTIKLATRLRKKVYGIEPRKHDR